MSNTLNLVQFQHYCRDQGISTESCDLIARIRLSQPVRRVQGRAGCGCGVDGPCGQYISLKDKWGKEKTRELLIWHNTSKQKKKELSDVQITTNGRR